MPVRHSARSELARDPVAALAPGLRMDPRKLRRKPRIIQITVLLQAIQHCPHIVRPLGAPLEQFAHLVDRMSPAHQRAQCGVVEFTFGRKFLW